MLIDWFTVGAQALNFIVLVWLMKHFLYKPVLDAIDTREKRIEAELADADRKKADAQKERDDFQRKNDDFETQRVALLAQATSDADAERQRLMEGARKAADAFAIHQQESLAGDAKRLSQALCRRVQQQVFAISRRALKDLATAELEASACDVFTHRLRALDGPARSELENALKSTGDPALVRSAFDLPSPQRDAVQKAVNETFSMAASLRFETAPDLVSGIELSAQGRKFAWSIAGYLDSMDRSVGELLKARPSPKSAPDVSQAPEVKAIAAASVP